MPHARRGDQNHLPAPEDPLTVGHQVPHWQEAETRLDLIQRATRQNEL